MPYCIKPKPWLALPIGLLASAASVAVAAPAHAAAPHPPAVREGCTAIMGMSCRYTATRPGGIVTDQSGPWKVVIHRGEQTIIYNELNAKSIVGVANVIQPGDDVVATADLPYACICCPVLIPNFVSVGTNENDVAR